MRTPLRTKLPLRLAVAVAGFALIAPGYIPGQEVQWRNEPKSKGPDKGPAKTEVRFADDGAMKLVLIDEKLELVTPYGKLLIPVADIVQIDFATRVPEELSKKIDSLIEALKHEDYSRRNKATAELAALGESAYGALLKAAKDADPEVVRRAEGLLAKLREKVPAENLEIRTHDVVWTADSKITGHLSSTTLKVKTPQFGDQQIRLTDLRSLRTPSVSSTSVTAAYPPTTSLQPVGPAPVAVPGRGPQP
jgi:hypothetical protein